jgi:hypothetical protein
VLPNPKSIGRLAVDRVSIEKQAAIAGLSIAAAGDGRTPRFGQHANRGTMEVFTEFGVTVRAAVVNDKAGAIIGLTFGPKLGDNTRHNEKQELRPFHRRQSCGGEPTSGD